MRFIFFSFEITVPLFSLVKEEFLPFQEYNSRILSNGIIEFILSSFNPSFIPSFIPHYFGSDFCDQGKFC
jgi:hypothetical protein